MQTRLPHYTTTVLVYACSNYLVYALSKQRSQGQELMSCTMPNMMGNQF